MEDLNLYLKDVLTERPHTRVPSADCGSYSEDIVKTIMEHTDKFYIRAGQVRRLVKHCYLLWL